MSTSLEEFWARRDPWAEKLVEHVDGWQIASARAPTGRWWSWGKMGQIQGKCPLSERGAHVWANYGATREEAVRKTKEELGLIH